VASDIHPSAVVDPGAELGADVRIGPGCIVESDVVVGDGCRLEPYCQVKRFTRMGRENHLHSHAIVGGEPQDLKFHGEESLLLMGDNNVVREFVTIHRGTEGGGGETTIGSGCLIMAYVHIAHDCRLGDAVILSNAANLAGHILIHDRAVVGGMTGVHQFTRIGEHAFVGAMSGVAQDIPPYMLATGNRAKLHGPNLIGLRRAGFDQQALSMLKKAYALIFRSGTERREALAEAERLYGSPEVERLVQFIRESERGTATASRNGEVEAP
jgi:UDP-N-acetylglucosamine acyltransferase